MNLNNLLFWEKYRPKSFKQLILLKRIDDLVKNGVQTNYIFYGTHGTGKTSLGRILTENQPCLELNTSDDNSISDFRNIIKPFVSKLDFNYPKDALKIVFLNEFERASPEYQDALKAYIEEVSGRARFIFITNRLSKIDENLASRCTKICFDPLDDEERIFLKYKYLFYLKAVCKAEKITLDDETLNKVINKNFPDLRASIQTLQDYSISKNINLINNTSNYYLETFNFMLNGKNDINEIYDFVIADYILREDVLLLNLGRPFFIYLREKYSEFIPKCGQDFINLCKNYNKDFNTTIDQTMHVVMFVIELKNILKRLL